MKYKALICDVDGTLVPNRPNGVPSEKVKQAISQAKKKLYIGLATARSYYQVLPLMNELDLSGPCIITGGAQIINPVTKKIYSEKLLSLKDIQEVTHIANQWNISLTVADTLKEFPLNSEYIPAKPFDIYTEPLPMNTAKDFMHALSHIKTINTYTSLAWEPDNKIHVTIACPESTKQHGILEVAEILGISTREIIGIGEGYNDFPLLMACGLKIAMDNAVPDVKAIADYISPSVEEDGVADAIERFVL